MHIIDFHILLFLLKFKAGLLVVYFVERVVERCSNCESYREITFIEKIKTLRLEIRSYISDELVVRYPRFRGVRKYVPFGTLFLNIQSSTPVFNIFRLERPG